jgi:hypothetical protein
MRVEMHEYTDGPVIKAEAVNYTSSIAYPFVTLILRSAEPEEGEINIYVKSTETLDNIQDAVDQARSFLANAAANAAIRAAAEAEEAV